MCVPFIIPDGGGFVKLDAGWIFRYHGPDDEVMTMQYLCAPMEGVTGDLFRQAQRQTFPAADSYYTPFLSPTANRTFSPRELREIEPAHNAGIRVVPQLMGHCAEDFLWMAGQLADMGYDEVNFKVCSRSRICCGSFSTPCLPPVRCRCRSRRGSARRRRRHSPRCWSCIMTTRSAS